jgi:diguanylate cyclase (GGDEF)-like protein
VIGLCLMAAFLTGLVARRVIESSLRSGVEAELERELQRLEAGFDAWRMQGAEDLAEFAREPALLAALARRPAADGAVRRALSEHLEAEPEVIGLALFRGRSVRADVTVAIAEWLPERWADAIDVRSASTTKPEIVRFGVAWVVLVPAELAGPGERSTLFAALNPRAAFTSLGRSSLTRIAIVDERGELIAGTKTATELARANGFAAVRDADGAPVVAMRRELAGTPWRVAMVKPEPDAPPGVLTSIASASLLIAVVAGVIAFLAGERRMRPLDELAEGARRLAAGESGVRVGVRSARGEVQALASSFNDMASQLETQRRALEERNVELLRANEVLEQLSITDGLTHLHNHRHFHDQFAREVKRADRSGQPLCLMLIDIDDFKVLNDNYGHAAGDMVLAVTAQLMNSQVRESDYLARYGGEEFAMLLPQTQLEGAVALAEKIRSVLSEHHFSIPESGENGRVTVSIGVAEHATTAAETFDAADRALYEAKGAGKDCVIVAPVLDRPSPAPRRRR